MLNLYKYKRHIAALFLSLLLSSAFFEQKAMALTSGPDLPETKGFLPIGVNDMVDLFTGDFRYNIPLMDVGGYPLNLSYASGQSMDDEASWVGFGWSLTPPVINRDLRGIPDDYDGTNPVTGDVIEKQMAMKPSITRGIGVDVKLKIKGKPIKVLDKIALDNVKIGFSYSNLTGVNAEIGFNSTTSLNKQGATPQTLNLGITSNNQDGGNLGGTLNLSVIAKGNHNKEYKAGTSLGFGYNATKGLEGMTLSSSFSGPVKFNQKRTAGYQLGVKSNSYISFAGDSYVSSIDIPLKSNNFSFTLRGGGFAIIPSFAGGINGFYSKQEIDPSAWRRGYPAFGLMNAYKARNIKSAMMDYNKENDRPYVRSTPYLPVPVVNNDLFTVSNQLGGGQYKIAQTSSGILFNTAMRSKDKKLGAGVEIDGGYVVKASIDFTYSNTTSSAEKWTSRNNYKEMGEFQGSSIGFNAFPEAYFKKVGDITSGNKIFRDNILGKEAAAVSLDNSWAARSFGKGATLNKIVAKSGKSSSTQLSKPDKENVGELFSYLTSNEATKYGLDKTIPNYPSGSIILKGCNDYLVDNLARTSGPLGKKGHHISEINVLDKSGTRHVYGVPVYNIRQDEVSFSVSADENARKKGLIQYANLQDSVPTGSSDTRFSTNDYRFNFNKQRMRGYAGSYLLTGILSPDYVDVTGNGISDDDKGTAVKFNHTKVGDFKWRTPFVGDSINLPRMANYNEGFLSDKKDDKASYVYGEKEQWYLHSVESKTMMAIFILEDRDDALGVSSSNGDLNTSFRLKRLKEIRLYSKSELYKNQGNLSAAIPIKTVHFEYTYDLFKGIPNSINRSKLTLKKVYFTFGANNQGKLQPYIFNYTIPDYQEYGFRQYDRWGMYKPADSCNRSGLNNSEFPYSTQDTVMADRWASYWQLNKIELPSGGTINVNYESDDYAYVQNKRSQSMCFIKGIGDVNDSTNVINSNTVFIDLPQPVTDVAMLKERYFGDMTYLYFKALVDMNNKGSSFEYIPGYARIEKIELYNTTTAKVTISKQDGYNPISKAAWGIMRNSLPKLAYPEYDNLDSDEPNVIKGIRSLVGAIGRIADIVRSFDKRASNKKFANKIIPSKSWVRLAKPDFKKIGGGSRVKSVLMSDKWSEMTGEAAVKTAMYGQLFDYTTTSVLQSGEKIPISSGVASYEPQVGADENPFKTPVLFTQKKILGVDEHYSIDLPLCESYYPGPGVGYSKVSVKNIGADNSTGATGSTVSEFYTAKDFPTRVEATPIQRQHPVLSNVLKFFAIKLTDHATVSQGYVVENFNMHGKEKSELIVDKTGQEISSVSFEYKIKDKGQVNKQLNNTVSVVDPSGTITEAEMGVDYDFYTDMNEHETTSIGVRGEPAIGAYYIVLPKVWINIGMISPNYDKKIFRSAVAIKAINNFPILSKVIKREKGSRIETENMLWDAVTGNVVLTKTQNEFDDPLYSLTYPAHWAYKGMGLASQNQGLYLKNFYTTSDGQVSNFSFAPLVVPGDELIDVDAVTPKKYWVIKGTDNLLRVIDENGIIANINFTTIKLLRSGRRNMTSAGMATVVSLNSPIQNGKIEISDATRILDAKSIEYKDEWAMPISLRCSYCPYLYESYNRSFCYLASQAASSCTGYGNCPSQLSVHGIGGTYIYGPGYTSNGSGTVISDLQTSYWKNISSTLTGGPLNRCGRWACGTTNQNTSNATPFNTWIGYTYKLQIPVTKTYYIGIGADNFARFKIDGNTLVSLGSPGPNGVFYSANFQRWHVYPITLTAGSHFLEVSGRNDGSYASFGFELYDNTVAELQSATVSSPPNIISSTNDFFFGFNTFDNGTCKTCPDGYAYNSDDNRCYLMATTDPTINMFNPYKAGIAGNWRAFKEYVFDVNRVNLKSDPLLSGATDIRNSGYYKNYAPFWTYSSGNWIKNAGNALFPQWRWSTEVTQYNLKGMEVESKDALGRFSSAQMGYLQSLPVAVAANAELRNIGYDGFEDYSFDLQCGTDNCNAYPGHFNFKKLLNGTSIKIDESESHSGKSSLKLTTLVTMTRPLYDGLESLYLRDPSHQFQLRSNYPMLGFNPYSNFKFVLSFWVKDNNSTSNTPGLTIAINGNNVDLSTYKAPIVEGWKKVEVPIYPTGGSPFVLTIAPGGGGTVYVDDIRIHPFDSQLKSFVYDPVTLRLMTELDENNFATFYEYDDEGILIRVKKETEKGIMTIKESRTGIRRTL